MRKERAGERGKSGIWPASMDNYEVCRALSPSLSLHHSRALRLSVLKALQMPTREERSGEGGREGSALKKKDG